MPWSPGCGSAPRPRGAASRRADAAPAGARHQGRLAQPGAVLREHDRVGPGPHCGAGWPRHPPPLPLRGPAHAGEERAPVCRGSPGSRVRPRRATRRGAVARPGRHDAPGSGDSVGRGTAGTGAPRSRHVHRPSPGAPRGRASRGRVRGWSERGVHGASGDVLGAQSPGRSARGGAVAGGHGDPARRPLRQLPLATAVERHADRLRPGNRAGSRRTRRVRPELRGAHPRPGGAARRRAPDLTGEAFSREPRQKRGSCWCTRLDSNQWPAP